LTIIFAVEAYIAVIIVQGEVSWEKVSTACVLTWGGSTLAVLKDWRRVDEDVIVNVRAPDSSRALEKKRGPKR